MSNNKNEEKGKEGSFDPGCITDIQDKLLSHNYVLSAFATLLMSSDLSDFATQCPTDVHSESNYEADTLRFGLSQIIGLYLAHQERIIEEYVDQYHKSAICLVKWAKSTIDMVGRGAYTSKDVAICELRKKAANLDTVINRDGELKGKAEELQALRNLSLTHRFAFGTTLIILTVALQWLGEYESARQMLDSILALTSPVSQNVHLNLQILWAAVILQMAEGYLTGRPNGAIAAASSQRGTGACHAGLGAADTGRGGL